MTRHNSFVRYSVFQLASQGQFTFALASQVHGSPSHAERQEPTQECSQISVSDNHTDLQFLSCFCNVEETAAFNYILRAAATWTTSCILLNRFSVYHLCHYCQAYDTAHMRWFGMQPCVQHKPHYEMFFLTQLAVVCFFQNLTSRNFNLQ